MGIRIDTDEMARQAGRIEAALAEARAITGHTHQMLGTAWSLADGPTCAGVVAFVRALARSLESDTGGLARLAEGLQVYAGTAGDAERAVAAALGRG